IRPEGAITWLRRACEVEPDNGLNHIALAEALLQHDQAEAALPSAERAVEFAPTAPAAYLALGAAARRTGDLQRAREAYSRALDLDPDNADARAGLAHLAPGPR
ncbi:MAG TPA: tetratricopeptide repeat protein, partial [Armatimonadota bacterium]|nr:tetratricopeptide repeat protein [Armatimonadota bacterium]